MKAKSCRKWQRMKRFYSQCPAIDGSCWLVSRGDGRFCRSGGFHCQGADQTEQLSNRVPTANPRPANERCDSILLETRKDRACITVLMCCFDLHRGISLGSSHIAAAAVVACRYLSLHTAHMYQLISDIAYHQPCVMRPKLPECFD
jgi:hypothetical protein